MSKQVLQMKYHPAKKEVEFKRFQSGNEIVIRSDSRLMQYMNKRGKFVLQDHGNEFFKDITYAFDGETEVRMEVITTKSDFEDFQQMIEYFNEESDCKITATLLSELPDMNDTYNTIKKHGEDSVAILNHHRTGLWDGIPLTNDAVKTSIEKFAADFQREITNINEKINSMAQNSVNLCFTGVYSSGKSALINAILGYKILPEAVTSETARMFIIESPEQGTNVRIVFQIRNSYCELVWNDNGDVFEFVAGPTESEARKTIQEVIENNRQEKQYTQINEILQVLNSCNDVSNDIKIYFPIPIDTQTVKFKIYDTPGTDSNVEDHKQTLKDALSEQTHSILIFVVHPTKLEGAGNNALLNYLKEAEEKDSKTSIDIGRSLFVVNRSDDNMPKDRIKLQQEEIKSMDEDGNVNFSIKLSDKKLFFASAMCAYASKAIENEIATEEDEYVYHSKASNSLDEKFGRYYKQNRCATSELATKKMIEKTDVALQEAIENGDETRKYYICSGVYTLEEEIKTYGEKYASAVKAYAIIDSVDKALSKMKATADSLNNTNIQDINEIQSQINEIKNNITNQIYDVYDKYAINNDDALPDDMLNELQIDAYAINRLIETQCNKVDSILKKMFKFFGKVKANDEHKKKIISTVNGVMNDFKSEFRKKGSELLKNTRDDFIKDVKDIINKNGKLSKEAKQFICEIKTPQIDPIEILSGLNNIYDNNTQWGGLFKKTQYIDKKQYMEDFAHEINDITVDVVSKYVDEYKESLKILLEKITFEFTTNIDNYSELVKAKLADKESMEKLGVKIQNAADNLTGLQQELNSLIWEAKNNAQ